MTGNYRYYAHVYAVLGRKKFTPYSPVHPTTENHRFLQISHRSLSSREYNSHHIINSPVPHETTLSHCIYRSLVLFRAKRRQKAPLARACSCSVINTADGSCNHRRQSFEPIRTPCFNVTRMHRRREKGSDNEEERRVAKSGGDSLPEERAGRGAGGHIYRCRRGGRRGPW